MINKIKNVFKGIALLAVSGLALSSCKHFDEKLELCPQGVELRFIYEYNMEFANAFYSQVDCLTLYVYDSDGKYVTSRIVTDKNLLGDEDWRMKLDLPAGTYSFLAYGGMACKDASFEFNNIPSQGSSMSSLEVFLKPQLITSPNGTELHPLFYGRLQLTVTDNDTELVKGTVKMMKDTNDIRILLCHEDGTPVHDADFTYYITDNNTRFNWLNNLMPQPEITYCPYSHGDIVTPPAPKEEPQTLAYAEFSTSRIMENSSMVLHIRRVSDGGTVMDIDLPRFLLMLKSDNKDFKDMEPQEFLDRESRWKVVFFLNESNKWIKVKIVVNDWVIRINNIQA